MESEDGNTSPADEPSMEDADSKTSIANISPGPSTIKNCVRGKSVSYCINFNLEQCNEGLKTSIGNNIKRLVGIDADLVRFDDLQFTLKAAKKAGNHSA